MLEAFFNGDGHPHGLSPCLADDVHQPPDRLPVGQEVVHNQHPGAGGEQGFVAAHHIVSPLGEGGGVGGVSLRILGAGGVFFGKQDRQVVEGVGHGHGQGDARGFHRHHQAGRLVPEVVGNVPAHLKQQPCVEAVVQKTAHLHDVCADSDALIPDGLPQCLHAPSKTRTKNRNTVKSYTYFAGIARAK